MIEYAELTSSALQLVVAVITGVIVYQGFRQQRLLNIFELNQKGVKADIERSISIIQNFLELDSKDAATGGKHTECMHTTTRQIAREFQLLFDSGVIPKMDPGEVSPTYALYSQGEDYAFKEYSLSYKACEASFSFFDNDHKKMIDVVRAFECLPKPEQFLNAMKQVLAKYYEDDALAKKWMAEDEAYLNSNPTLAGLSKTMKTCTVTITGGAPGGSRFAYVAIDGEDQFLKLCDKEIEDYFDTYDHYPAGGDELVLRIYDGDQITAAYPLGAVNPKSLGK